MNWLDIAIILALAYSAYAGTKGGFVLGLIELVGIIISIAIPLMLWEPAGRFFAAMGVAKAFSGLTGFLVILAITTALYFSLMQRIYKRIHKYISSSRVNKYLGAVTGFARGVIIVAMLVTLAAVAPVSPISQNSISGSYLSQPMLMSTMGFAASVSGTFGTAVHEAMGFMTVRQSSDERINLGFKAVNPTIDAPAENEMLLLVNYERTSRGLAALGMDTSIRNVARGYSIYMLKNGYFSHVAPDGSAPLQRMLRGRVRFDIVGENLAYAPTVQMAHSGLMKSPGHRANILNPEFRRIGIGVAHAGKYRTMFTQNFAR